MLTGKGLNWGGSLIRPEATGYGAVYFAEEMLATRGDSVKGKIGRGLRLGQRGPVHRREAQPARRARPSRSPTPTARSYDEDGIDAEKLAWVMDLKNVRRGRISEYADKFKGAKYLARQAAVGRQVRRAPSPAPRRTRSTARTPRRW